MIVSVKIENQQYDVDIADINTRPVIAKIGNDTFEVHLAESKGVSAPIQNAASLSSVVSAPMAAAPVVSGGGGNVISAPIPGIIIELFVAVGDSVEVGKEVCTLEAMKMKNAIRATRSGKIGAIHVSIGQQVRHGQALVEFVG